MDGLLFQKLKKRVFFTIAHVDNSALFAWFAECSHTRIMSTALNTCTDEYVRITNYASFTFTHIGAGITISGIESLIILTPLRVKIASLTPFFTAINNNFPA